MKLIAQIAVGIILGWLGIQVIIYLDGNVLSHRPLVAAKTGSMSSVGHAPKIPTLNSPLPAAVTAPEPAPHPAKRCEITRADGTTVNCAGLAEPQ